MSTSALLSARPILCNDCMAKLGITQIEAADLVTVETDAKCKSCSKAIFDPEGQVEGAKPLTERTSRVTICLATTVLTSALVAAVWSGVNFILSMADGSV